jgi:hypothetical protein
MTEKEKGPPPTKCQSGTCKEEPPSSCYDAWGDLEPLKKCMRLHYANNICLEADKSCRDDPKKCNMKTMFSENCTKEENDF